MPEGKKPHPNTGRTAHRIPEERKAAARILYETIPGMSQEKVAEQVGVSTRTVEDWSRKEGWNKAPLLPPKSMSETAQAVADQYVSKLADYGPEITDEDKQVALLETAEKTAIELRAALIDRHRKEWAGPRKLVYEAIRNRDFELAKLAKITAEQLEIVQRAERKAWGILDKEGESKTTTVIIDRDRGP